ncbi:hypothetical protein CDL15_Pgr025404 [Punica granatum]|uniref:Uncharacterized protein n=1 Tax=Punica granatum TaxID=22663 RepID=A0A218W8L7_PUNGR|nr:hypothetical protein CDL15_Pgr025404 [Punica granatum]
MGRGWRIGPTGLDLQQRNSGPKPVSEELRRKVVLAAPIGRERRFRLLDAATTTRKGSGEGSEHRLGRAGSDLGFADGWDGRNQGNFTVFRRYSDRATICQISPIREESYDFFLWVPLCPRRIRLCVRRIRFSPL